MANFMNSYYGNPNSYGNGYMEQPYMSNQNPYSNPYQYSNNQNMQYQPYNNQYSQQPQTQNTHQNQAQQTFVPLTFVNGVEGAKAYLLMPNKSIYLMDSDSLNGEHPMLYLKKCDSQGICSLEPFELTRKTLDKSGNIINTNTKDIKVENTLTKNDISNLATKTDLQAFVSDFDNKINKLSTMIENAYRKPKNNNSNGDK